MACNEKSFLCCMYNKNWCWEYDSMEMNHSGYVVKDKGISRTFKCNIEGQKMLKDGENVPSSNRKWFRSSFNSGMFEKDKRKTTDKILMVDIKGPNYKTLLDSKTFSSEMIV